MELALGSRKRYRRLLSRASPQLRVCLREIILQKEKVDILPYIDTFDYDDQIDVYCKKYKVMARTRTSKLNNIKEKILGLDSQATPTYEQYLSGKQETLVKTWIVTELGSDAVFAYVQVRPKPIHNSRNYSARGQLGIGMAKHTYCQLQQTFRSIIADLVEKAQDNTVPVPSLTYNHEDGLPIYNISFDLWTKLRQEARNIGSEVRIQEESKWRDEEDIFSEGELDFQFNLLPEMDEDQYNDSQAAHSTLEKQTAMIGSDQRSKTIGRARDATRITNEGRRPSGDTANIGSVDPSASRGSRNLHAARATLEQQAAVVGRDHRASFVADRSNSTHNAGIARGTTVIDSFGPSSSRGNRNLLAARAIINQQTAGIGREHPSNITNSYGNHGAPARGATASDDESIPPYITASNTAAIDSLDPLSTGGNGNLRTARETVDVQDAIIGRDHHVTINAGSEGQSQADTSYSHSNRSTASLWGFKLW